MWLRISMRLRIFSNGVEEFSMRLRIFSNGVEEFSMRLRIFSNGVEEFFNEVENLNVVENFFQCG